jgi:hypothetical protein
MSDDIIKRLREVLAAFTNDFGFANLRTYDIRALLDRLDDLETQGAQAVRWAPSSAHWSNELKRLFGTDARKGIDNLEKQLRDVIAERDAAEAEIERLRKAAKKVDALSIQSDAHKELRAALKCDCAAKDMAFLRCCKLDAARMEK